MKKVLMGLLFMILIIAITGCGGSAPVGKTMTQSEINQLYSDTTTAQTGFDYGKSYITLPAGMTTSSVSPIVFGAKAVPSFTWTQESLGWYRTMQTINSIAYTFRIRYIEATNTIEFSQSFEMNVMGVIITNTTSFSLTKNNTEWSGSATVGMSFSTGGSMTLEVAFTNINPANGCGTFDMWFSATGGTSNISRTQYAHFSATFNGTHTPPVLLTGWFGIGIDKITFPADHWVNIPVL